jgi:hypothetical protein
MTVVLVVVGCLVVVGAVLTFRAPTPRERAAGVAATLLPVLLLGGPALLWPCGENGCGPLLPAYYALLAIDGAALLLLLYGPGAGRKRGRDA